ncbi:MAG: efflux RND transporter permease subunit [Thiotrichaceae bacterium]
MTPGVPATIMEEQVTRELEASLALTEDAISIQSRSSEGRCAIDLSFPYGKDIDIALRDASAALTVPSVFYPIRLMHLQFLNVTPLNLLLSNLRYILPY